MTVAVDVYFTLGSVPLALKVNVRDTDSESATKVIISPSDNGKVGVNSGGLVLSYPTFKSRIAVTRIPAILSG